MKLNTKYKAAIICPVSREYNICKKILGLENEKYVNSRRQSHTIKNGVYITAVAAGLGKINCAAAVQRLISESEFDIIIDSGSAGSLAGACAPGDIIFCDNSFEYDILPITQFHKLKKELKTSSVIKEILDDNVKKVIFNDFCEAVRARNGRNIFTGGCASGEKDVNSREFKETLVSAFNCIICDWETSAVLKTSNMSSTACLSIRTISDGADENMAADYSKNVNNALETLYETIAMFLYDDWLLKLKIQDYFKKNKKNN